MSPANALVREIEGRGGRLELHARGVRIEPAALLTPDLVARLRAVGRELVELLREREQSSPPTIACELRCFPDSGHSRAVRFCCESTHRHASGAGDLLFDAEELDLLIAWSLREHVREFPIELRNALVAVKAAFGGRIDPTTVLAAANALGRHA